MKTKILLSLTTLLMLGILLTPAPTSSVTKLSFDAIEYLDDALIAPPPTNEWIEDGVYHIGDMATIHGLVGTVGDDEITGMTSGLWHFKMDLATGDMMGHGICYFEFTWNGMFGYFEGVANFKINEKGLYGMFNLKGYLDFDGMKLSGEFYGISPTENAMVGTILIPN